MVKISYAICCCTENKELDKLLDHLYKYIDENDEVIIVVDQNNFNDEVIDICKKYEKQYSNFKWYWNSLNKNFAQHKNYLNECCNGDWIFNIDPDEIPNEFLIKNLKTIIQSNPDIEAYRIPRINIVENISDEYIKQMGWIKNEKGWINWPFDSQMRIYKNKEQIKWINPVHEQLIGYSQFANLPNEEEYSLLHIKSFERQVKQNEFYNKITQ